MKWLPDNKGNRKHHRTARNLGNEKVVSSISASKPPRLDKHSNYLSLVSIFNLHRFCNILNSLFGNCLNLLEKNKNLFHRSWNRFQTCPLLKRSKSVQKWKTFSLQLQNAFRSQITVKVLFQLYLENEIFGLNFFSNFFLKMFHFKKYLLVECTMSLKFLPLPCIGLMMTSFPLSLVHWPGCKLMRILRNYTRTA